MWNWLNGFRARDEQRLSARWLEPGENIWGLPVFDCSESASSMMSTTSDPGIAMRYTSLRDSTGEELRKKVFKPALSFPCSLTYSVKGRGPDGPVYKSQVMEEKWDVYFYDDHFYFCRSWQGELMYRVKVQRGPPALKVVLIEGSHKTNEKITLRDVDFLMKSHVRGAVALHPLPRELGRDAQKLAVYSFSAYGRLGMYGTFEETVGTPYYRDRSIAIRK
jgi:hypothetical protein